MITPGHHVYPASDGIWRYSAPRDRFVRVNGPDHLLRALQQVAHGAADTASLALEEEGRAAFDTLLQMFRHRGVLTVEGETPSETAWSVHVEGDNPVGECVATLLRPHADVTRGEVDEGVVTRSDVIVTCAGWLPDQRWLQVDEWCTQHRTPWHMSHAEHTDFIVGPLFVPGRTASYSDTRGRRLAASGVADELLAHWDYLAGPDPKPPVPWPSVGAAVPAGVIAGDVLALLGGAPIPTEHHQVVMDLAKARFQRHPVLPIPRLAPPAVAADAMRSRDGVEIVRTLAGSA